LDQSQFTVEGVSASDAHVGVHLPQGVTHSGEIAAQVLHHVLDAAGVFEQVDALRVRVVVHRERALYRLRKLPVRQKNRVRKATNSNINTGFKILHVGIS